MNAMLSLRLKRAFLFLLPISLMVLLVFFLTGYIAASFFTNMLLILLALILMGVTVRLVLERDRRMHDQQKKRSGASPKK